MAEWSLYTAPEGEITPDLVRSFIDSQRGERLLAESMTLELKQRRHHDNIARAVAGFANSDGGLILVGVDEKEPSFDNSPGVPPSEVVAIAESCRSVLSPLLTPTIVPVALPNGETVVIVVRVDADPTVRPVCKGGTVYVRAPGQTVPATREQILSLATQPTSSGLQHPVAHSIGTLFIPELANENPPYTALIRIASGLTLRHSATDLVFGDRFRESVKQTIESTALFLYPATTKVQWRAASNRPQVTTAGFSATAATFLVDYVDGASTTSVSAAFRMDGPRVSYALDTRLRIQSPSADNPASRLGRSELVASVLAGIEVASLILPDAIATAAKSAPQRLDPVHVWVQNPQMGFDRLLDMDGTQRSATNWMGSQWGWTRPAPTTEDQMRDMLLAELERLYLNLGIEDADGVAAGDMASATRDLRYVTTELEPAATTRRH